MNSQVKRLIKLAVSANIFLFDCLVGYFLSIIKKSRATCVTLYYHAIYSEERNKFAEQMDDLLHWTIPISLKNSNRLDNGIRYSAVTFDDGLTCVIENALPVLTQRKIPFTIFVPTGYIGKRSSWAQQDNQKTQQDAVVTEEQLRALANNELVVIGSHCVSHSNLLSIDNESARNEIYQSKNDLESILGLKVKLLSFPYGGYTAIHIKLAKEAGYERLFTILPSCINSELNDFVMGRVRVDPSDWRLEYRLKLLGAYRWLPKAFLIKQQIRCLYKSND
jgi:peptidoglycan/xylan/chitin deacetylase (PgdA/CDA1 family)